jgi:hypothetical protein
VSVPEPLTGLEERGRGDVGVGVGVGVERREEMSRLGFVELAR